MVIGAIAILFLRQASATSFGHAGQDVGSGLTGISSGISNLFNSFINPISSLFGSLTSIFSLGLGEQNSQAQNDYGYVRQEPTADTSRRDSNKATQHTINASQGGYTAGAISHNKATGGFGAAN